MEHKNLKVVSRNLNGASDTDRGDTVEYARLDRIHMSEGADWIESKENLHHDGWSGLSDRSGYFILKLKKDQQAVRKWRTYFKCPIEEVKQEGVLQELEKVWKDNPASLTDPRIRRELGWATIKKILQRRRRESKEKDHTHETITEKLAKARTVLAMEDTAANRL
ncbi:hypothetical protein R1sor_011705 [Riccia sorocarpa]|uniref:Uncharacterized protein n=1 Tax=Riccia sorocarpa TaxID=122646 RepID=A0ABD3I3J1_9MARC